MEDHRLVELHDERSSPLHEARGLLKLAEDLQEKCESLEHKNKLNMFILYVMFVFFIIFDWLLESRIDNSKLSNVLYIILTIAGSSLVLFQWYKMTSRSRKLLLRERRALHKVVDMLREIEGPLTSNLSTLECAEFRARLSRLDIGPGGP